MPHFREIIHQYYRPERIFDRYFCRMGHASTHLYDTADDIVDGEHSQSLSDSSLGRLQ